MANIRKSFNFRTGLQVDNDNFVVNENGLVGIGTSIPQNYLFNVHGNTRVTGLTTTGNLYAGIGTVSVLNSTNSTVGTLTATNLSVTSLTISGSSVAGNFIGYAFTAWVSPDGVGLTTTGTVGIGTTAVPTEQLRVVGDAAITGDLTLTSGGINASSGVVTASSFSGSLSSSDLTGTIDNARLPTNINKPTGIITASSFVGNLTGTATTATNLDSSANITAVSVNAGIITASTRLYTPSIGVGTNSPGAQLHLRKTGISSLQLTSDGSNESIITLGRSTTPNVDNGQIRFGHGNALGSYPYSTNDSLDIINYDTGNLNFYLNPSGLGTAFNWLTTASNRAMVLTQSGNLGINSTSPAEKLDVTGNIVASGSITGNTIVKVGGASTQFLKADGSVDSNTYLTTSGNGSGLSGIVTSLIAGSNISITGSTGQVTISASGGGSVTVQDEGIALTTGATTLNFVGAGVTASGTGTTKTITINGGSGGGGGLSNVVEDTTPQLGGNLDLNSNDITGTGNFNVTGIITATSFEGDGSNLTGPSRQSLVQSTGSIGAGSTANITITGYKTYALQKVGISSAAWVRLYTDADSRTADESRDYLTDPTPGSGVIAEVYTTNTGISTFLMSPGIIGWNNDGTPSTNIYARVTNNESSSADITVTLTAVKLED